MSILRVSSATMVSSKRSSKRRSLRSTFFLEALRAATVGMTPEDAAEERLEEDVMIEEEEEEDAFFRLDEPSVIGSAASVDEALSRVDLRECAAILLHVSMFEAGVTVERKDEARSI